jgi:hypothetical protein
LVGCKHRPKTPTKIREQSKTQVNGFSSGLTFENTIKYASNTSLSTLLVERGKAVQVDAIVVFIRFLCAWGLGRYHSDNKAFDAIITDYRTNDFFLLGRDFRPIWSEIPPKLPRVINLFWL